MSITSRILSFVARSILFLMGWSSLTDETLNGLNEYKRVVLVFSHTSYFDFYIMILYLLAYPYQLANVRTLVKPQPFRHFGKLLRSFGAIPSTKVEDKQGGGVSRIVQSLKEKNECLFLISPKGTILKREWRSGYYHIAKLLEAPIRVIGLDYEKMGVTLSNAIASSNDESIVREFLYLELSKIVPLHPDQEVVPIKSHASRNIIGYGRLVGTCGVIFSLLSLGIEWYIAFCLVTFVINFASGNWYR
jgi:1-acyl-sn-glycerol-3-phosphate acyltransferase